jgi:hypothetical protein
MVDENGPASRVDHNPASFHPRDDVVRSVRVAVMAGVLVFETPVFQGREGSGASKTRTPAITPPSSAGSPTKPPRPPTIDARIGKLDCRGRIIEMGAA